MTTLLAESNAVSGTEQIESAWRPFFFERMGHFSMLARILLENETLVDCVMKRAMARLEKTPFYACDALLSYERARGAVLGEVTVALHPRQHSAASRQVRLSR